MRLSGQSDLVSESTISRIHIHHHITLSGIHPAAQESHSLYTHKREGCIVIEIDMLHEVGFPDSIEFPIHDDN